MYHHQTFTIKIYMQTHTRHRNFAMKMVSLIFDLFVQLYFPFALKIAIHTAIPTNAVDAHRLRYDVSLHQSVPDHCCVACVSYI